MDIVHLISDDKNFLYDEYVNCEDNKHKTRFATIWKIDDASILKEFNYNFKKDDLEHFLKQVIIQKRLDNYLKDYKIHDKKIFAIYKNNPKVEADYNVCLAQKLLIARDLLFQIDYLHLFNFVHKNIVVKNIFHDKLGPPAFDIEVFLNQENEYPPEFKNDKTFVFEKSFDIWMLGKFFQKILFKNNSDSFNFLFSSMINENSSLRESTTFYLRKIFH